MQSLTFPCPLCGRRVGAGAELGGKPVRCPHCRGVVVAPAADGTDQPRGLPTYPHRDDGIPDFSQLPGREVAESIFSEESADTESLFEGNFAARVEFPIVPDALEPTENVLREPEFLAPLKTGTADSAPATPTPIIRTIPPPITHGLVFADKPDTDAQSAGPNLERNQSSAPQRGQGARVAAIPDPWAKLEDSGPGAASPLLPALLPNEPDVWTHTPTVATVADARRPHRINLALAVYALLATIAAAYGLLRGGERNHPLNTIPDLFGEFKKVPRDRTTDLRPLLERMGWDGKTIPPELRVKLGGTLAVGDLTIQPLAVEEHRPRQLTVFTGPVGDAVPRDLPENALVLRLKLTNTGKDAAFHPTDPAFNRRELAGVEPPLTGLVLDNGQSRYMGGPIPWPFAAAVKRSYLDGQQSEADALAPGRSRESLIFSVPAKALTDRVRTSRKAVLWQVQLRRGTTRFHREDVPVCCLVGVEFEPSEVKMLPPGA